MPLVRERDTVVSDAAHVVPVVRYPSSHAPLSVVRLGNDQPIRPRLHVPAVITLGDEGGGRVQVAL